MGRLIRFRRLDRPCPIIDGVRIERWEVTFSERRLFAYLDGAMAEVDMPARPWWVRWWRRVFPVRFETREVGSMKVYKVELLIVDHDGIGMQEVCDVIENESYPNHCIAPRVMAIEARDVVFTDDHPLNSGSTSRAEFQRLFRCTSND